jgi:hypothetical protein
MEENEETPVEETTVVDTENKEPETEAEKDPEPEVVIHESKVKTIKPSTSTDDGKGLINNIPTPDDDGGIIKNETVA